MSLWVACSRPTSWWQSRGDQKTEELWAFSFCGRRFLSPIWKSSPGPSPSKVIKRCRNSLNLAFSMRHLWLFHPSGRLVRTHANVRKTVDGGWGGRRVGLQRAWLRPAWSSANASAAWTDSVALGSPARSLPEPAGGRLRPPRSVPLRAARQRHPRQSFTLFGLRPCFSFYFHTNASSRIKLQSSITATVLTRADPTD